MDNNTLYEALKVLDEQGIMFSVNIDQIGEIALSLSDVVEYIQDKDQFCSTFFDVDRETYIKQKNSGEQCTATPQEKRGLVIEIAKFRGEIFDGKDIERTNSK